MPSRKTNKKYSPEHLTECLRLIKEDEKSAADARKIIHREYDVVIPKATLSLHLKGRKTKDGRYKIPRKRVGAPTKLSPRQERILYDMCIKAWECATPLTRVQLCKTARDLALYERAAVAWISGNIIDQKPIFRRNKVSKEWVKGFLKRWSLSQRVCTDRDAKRTSALNAESLLRFFGKWNEAMTTGYIDGQPFPKERIWNMDEFGNQPRCEKQAKAICPRSAKGAVQRGGAGDRKSYTGVACVNAAGERLPLSFIFKLAESNWERKPILEITCKKGGVCCFATGQEETHFMTIPIFKGWVEWFAKKVGATPENPVLLLVDGHSSRFPREGIWFAHKYGVQLFILPGAVTSHLQPQDVGILGPFKRKVYDQYRDHCANLPWTPLRAHQHLKFVVNSWAKHVTARVIRNAWDRSGLVVNDHEEVPSSDIKKLIPALKMASVFRKDEYEESEEVKALLKMVWEAKVPGPEYLLDPGAVAPLPDPLVEALDNADVPDDVKEDMVDIFRIRSDFLAIPAERKMTQLIRAASEKQKAGKMEEKRRLALAKMCSYFPEAEANELFRLEQETAGSAARDQPTWCNIEYENEREEKKARLAELRQKRDSAAKAEKKRARDRRLADVARRKEERREAAARKKAEKQAADDAEKERKKAEREAAKAEREAAKAAKAAAAAAKKNAALLAKKTKAHPRQAGDPGSARGARKARSNLNTAPLDVSRDHATAPDEDWVQCCGPAGCGKWRRVPRSICSAAAAEDATWLCSDNLDEKHNRCDIPQELTDDEIDRQIEAATAAAKTQAKPPTTAKRARVGIGLAGRPSSPPGAVDGARRGDLPVAKRARRDHAAGHGKPPAAVKPRNPANLPGKRARPAGGAGGAAPSKIPKISGRGRAGKRPDTGDRIGITPGSSREKKPQLPKGRTLGCPKCRWGVQGCAQCRNPEYRPRKSRSQLHP